MVKYWKLEEAMSTKTFPLVLSNKKKKKNLPYQFRI